MSKLRTLLTVAASALVACGGAGTTAVPVAQSAAQVQGAILEVDGQTLDRDGIDVQIVETGDMVRSDATGAFQFPDLDSGRYTLDFNPDAARTLALEGEESEEEESEPKEQEGEEEKESEEEKDGDGEEEKEREEEKDGDREEEKEREEEEGESDEDEFGRPRIDVDREGPVVVIKVVLENGEVVRWSKSHPNHRFVRARMQRGEGAGDARGQIRLREWFRGERESLRFIVCGLDGGDAVEVFLRNSTEENAEFKSIRDAEADAKGCASVAFDTKGGWLPLEAESLSDLAGYDVEIRMAADGAVILTGEIPALPKRVERHEKDGDDDKEEKEEERDEKPEIAPAIYGKDRLIAQVDFLYGSVEIWDWNAMERQRFRMVAGGLDEGETVKFQIRHPETEAWSTFAVRKAQMRAEEGENFLAKVDTEWMGDLPLDVEDVEQLIGLGVRVVRETDDGDVVLLIGEIPNLSRD